MTMELPLGLIRDPENDKLVDLLRRLADYDFSAITQSCVQKYGWEASYAQKVEAEAKRFLALSVLDPGWYHIPEADTDEYWHRMILHTVWYAKFCLDVFGVFQHHTPTASPREVSGENRERSIAVAMHWFGCDWKSLVHTCTQCSGGVYSDSLRPSEAAIYAGV